MQKNKLPLNKETTTVAPQLLLSRSMIEKQKKIELIKNDYDLLVFCHLRWGFVYQRPQHIISRLAKNNKILLIEEQFHTRKKKKTLFLKDKFVTTSMFGNRGWKVSAIFQNYFINI